MRYQITEEYDPSQAYLPAHFRDMAITFESETDANTISTIIDSLGVVHEITTINNQPAIIALPYHKQTIQQAIANSTNVNEKMQETIKLSEYFHFVEYDAHIKGTKNEVDCPVIQAGEYLPVEDLDRVIVRWGGSAEQQEIYLTDSNEPDYIITQRLTIGNLGGKEYLEEWETK